MSAPHLDPLVTKAVKFLTSAVSAPARAALFKEAATLGALLEGVILPCIRLRPCDEEMLEVRACLRSGL